MSTEFNVNLFRIFVLITLEVNSKVIYDKETKHTLLITFTLLLIGWSNFFHCSYTGQLKTLKTICGQRYVTVSCWRQKLCLWFVLLQHPNKRSIWCTQVWTQSSTFYCFEIAVVLTGKKVIIIIIIIIIINNNFIIIRKQK